LDANLEARGLVAYVSVSACELTQRLKVMEQNMFDLFSRNKFKEIAKFSSVKSTLYIQCQAAMTITQFIMLV